MNIPWNMIFSKQNSQPSRVTGEPIQMNSPLPQNQKGWPGDFPTARTNIKLDERTKTSVVPINFSPPSPVSLHTRSSENQAFVPWVQIPPAPACEPQEVRVEDPPDDPQNADPPLAAAIVDEVVRQEVVESPQPFVDQAPPAECEAVPVVVLTDTSCLDDAQCEPCAPSSSGRRNMLRVMRRLSRQREALGGDRLEEDFSSGDDCRCEQDPDAATKSNPKARGLLYFKKWWYLRKIGVSVNGTLLHGIPIYIRKNTLRVVGNAHSYIIPMDKVDYIRTSDGLKSIETEFDGSILEKNPAP